MILLSVFLAFVGFLVGLHFWPALIAIAFSVSGLATAQHDASRPSDEFKAKVSRVVLITGGGWALFFGCVAALMSRVPTHPAAWVALFVGVALSGCFAVANYHRALRRLHAGASASDAKPVSKVRTFLKWCSSSLRGHIVLYQLLFAVPMFILFTYRNYTEGSLTFSWGIWIAFVAGCGGLFMALFQWFTFSRWFVYLRRDTERMKALLTKRKAAGDGLPHPRRF